MDKKEIIELLRKDMQGEQQAIIQYLNHAYAMEEGEVPGEIEGIAREEMRHYDWLADAITELGGDPTMVRDKPDLSPGSDREKMLKDVDLEQVAIDQYRDHIALIDNTKIQRLLAHILKDELFHQGQFRDLAEAVEDEAPAENHKTDGEASDTSGTPKERLAEVLNEGIRHEYTVILQYLYHSFVTEDCEEMDELQNAAINEMQHMGWLAEELAEKGMQPDFSHDELMLSRDSIKNLQANIAIESDVTKMYSAQIPEMQEGDIAKIMTRIRDQEIYHEEVFKYLLEEAKEHAAAKAAAAPCAEPAAEPVSEPDETDDTPAAPPLGSLKG